MSKDYTNELLELGNELRATSGYASVSYVDDSSVINIVNRDIQMPNNEVYAVCCDSNSQLLTFRVNRFIDGIDLSTKVASIKFVNAVGQSDRATPAKLVADGETITFTWLLDNRVTAGNGTVKFQIEFYEITAEDILYSWQTKMNKFEVLERLDVDGNIEQPTPTWLQAVMNEVNKISNLTAETKTLAPNNVATADVRLVDSRYNILFGIPRGAKGEKGDTGPKGDKGDKGEQGEKGEGYIPNILDLGDVENGDFEIMDKYIIAYGKVSTSLIASLNENYQQLGFISALYFTTPSEIPENYSQFPANVYFKGDNTEEGAFVPEANMRYTILFDFDGYMLNGYVSGVTTV